MTLLPTFCGRVDSDHASFPPHNMTTDITAPATKLDIRMLMEEIGKLYDANKYWKDEMIEHMRNWKDDTKLYFDSAVENILHDLKGANRDEIEVIKDRVTRLERHTGLAKAA